MGYLSEMLSDVGIEIPELEAYEEGTSRTKDADRAIDILVGELLHMAEAYDSISKTRNS